MINKILGILTITASVAAGVYAVSLIANKSADGWVLLGGSLFMILVGVVVYRHGIRGAVGAVGKGVEMEYPTKR